MSFLCIASVYHCCVTTPLLLRRHNTYVYSPQIGVLGQTKVQAAQQIGECPFLVAPAGNLADFCFFQGVGLV